MTDLNNRSKILQSAEALVNGDRNNQYGDPSQDFKRTAELWSAFLGTKIEAWQVAPMMALLKLSRISWNPSKEDSWADLIGYGACGWDVVVILEEEKKKAEELFLKNYKASFVEPMNE